jgi:hypothetical protein
MIEKTPTYLITVERIVAADAAMNSDEREALRAWEAAHVTGDGTVGTSDWPGWPAVFDRIAH